MKKNTKNPLLIAVLWSLILMEYFELRDRLFIKNSNGNFFIFLIYLFFILVSLICRQRIFHVGEALPHHHVLHSSGLTAIVN